MENTFWKWLLVSWCTVALVGLLAPTAQAGKIFRCTDAQGNLYLTDAGCPTDLQNQGTPGSSPPRNPPTSGHSRGQRNSQEPRALSASGHSVEAQLDRVEARNEQVRQRRIEEYERWQAEQGLGYADRTAARNAMVGSDKPSDAAEMAIQYNAKSISEGGRHQVPVPNVYYPYPYPYR